MLKIDNLHVRVAGKEILKGLTLEVRPGEVHAIMGPNGAGKSTLVSMLAGREPISSGERIEGSGTVISYFAQHQANELDGKLTVYDTVNEVAPGEGNTRLRTLLAAFLFRGPDAAKPVSVLSGGERNRLALAKMLLKPFNCLILDEPTNHLDMKSKAVLTEAIKNFPGTVVVVSHDRDFLDPIVTKVVEVRNGGIRVFLGNVTQYLETTAAERESERTAALG